MFSEKDLEDYICVNVDKLIEIMEDAFSNEFYEFDFRFIGRQIRIGNDNIADLCFEANQQIDGVLGFSFLIVVELKATGGTPSDFAQLCRYVSIARQSALDYDEVYGVLVTSGFSESLAPIIQWANDKTGVRFISIQHHFDFKEMNLTYIDEYLDSLKLDERLKHTEDVPCRTE